MVEILIWVKFDVNPDKKPSKFTKIITHVRKMMLRYHVIFFKLNFICKL